MMADQWMEIQEKRRAVEEALAALPPPVDKFGDGKVIIVSNGIAIVVITPELQVALYDHGDDRYSVEFDRTGAMIQVLESQVAPNYQFDLDWEVPNNMIVMDENAFMMLKLALQ